MNQSKTSRILAAIAAGLAFCAILAFAFGLVYIIGINPSVTYNKLDEAKIEAAKVKQCGSKDKVFGVRKTIVSFSITCTDGTYDHYKLIQVNGNDVERELKKIREQ